MYTPLILPATPTHHLLLYVPFISSHPMKNKKTKIKNKNIKIKTKKYKNRKK